MHILGPEESKIYIWECIYVQKEKEEVDKGLGWVLGWDNEAYKWGGGTMRGVRRVRGMSWGSTELGVPLLGGWTDSRHAQKAGQVRE